jgi:hypothetical protein
MTGARRATSAAVKGVAAAIEKVEVAGFPMDGLCGESGEKNEPSQGFRCSSRPFPFSPFCHYFSLPFAPPHLTHPVCPLPRGASRSSNRGVEAVQPIF